MRNSSVSRFVKAAFFCAIGGVFAGVLGAQTGTESPAQRQLRDDRQRFQRDVDRQRSDAQAREVNTRAALTETQTAADIERLRARQAAQQRSIDGLSGALTSPTEETLRSGELTAMRIQQSDVAPDFALTFLADGRCVIHRKGRLPEVHTLEEAQAILTAMAEQRPALKPSNVPDAKTGIAR